ncbi:ester cyclase [Pseudoponticoccus marisrubri]|uniref:Polyketide cyclase n=1 Tax=Pseudoponticoccus marisrubri TaxID=1685382 RepID=A0A0W7WJW6_9RHOB|nr:ester cyclase [Pseudoponticoccus marisrubri]KUF10831.1 polyketide cyclase [Pseudoponticoccus marisrubri]
MEDFQAEKAVVRAYYAALDAASGDETAGIMAEFTSPDYLWRGYHPFNEIRGAQAVAERFWAPLKSALTSLQRREDVFMAGANAMDGNDSVWVVSMGHLMGLFDAPWLGIRPTGKIAALRYCEFNRVENGRITESAMFFDIPHLMVQAGQNPFPPQTGAQLVQPGPLPHDALLFQAQPPEEGRRTLAAIEAMLADLGQWQSDLSLEDELARTWTRDMLWWGPTGIGSTYTIERYAKQHAGPFRAAFTERSKTRHLCRIAEGNYGGFFGWPNFTARHVGGFMGMPGTGQTGEFRVIDIYRREGDKLAENWIFIDLLHFWKTQGVDILDRTTAISA